MLQAKQKGFTLLELLVVIVLLALLSVGALVVYDGVTEKATDATAANNIVVLNRALRQAAVVNNGLYPDQWDTILDGDGNEPCWGGQKDPNKDMDATCGSNANLPGSVTPAGYQPLLANVTKSFLAKFQLTDDTTPDNTTVTGRVAQALDAVGIRTVQTVEAAIPVNVASGLVFNEGGNPDSAEENDILKNTGLTSDVAFAAVVSGVNGTCTAEGNDLAAPLYSGVDAAEIYEDSAFLNKISDRMEEEDCHLVLALGIGHDVAGQGAAGIVGLDTAATYNSPKVNAAYNYSRFLGLFYLGTAADGAQIQPTDIFEKARFVGVIDPEGRTADEAISGAFRTSTN